jgi:hypothetical protein
MTRATGYPQVAVVCRSSLLADALGSSLEGLAVVLELPHGRPDLGGLLDSLAPAGVVVDNLADGEAATTFALRTGAPLLRVSLPDARADRRGIDRWEPIDGEASPELLRNALLAGLSNGIPS